MPTPTDDAPRSTAASLSGEIESLRAKELPVAEAVTMPPSPTAAGAMSVSVAGPGYEVLGVLGRGGMGVVYKARQVQADRVVALKMILHAEHAGGEEHSRFQTEARAIARLQHPHIVQIYEIREHQGIPFFSLEFCTGGGLDRKLAGTPLEAKAAAELVEKLARAMHAAHQAQIVHRDLKPANVLLTTEGEPKITDFGLAKRLDEKGRTQTGALMGTPSYMAPEQAGGGKDVGPAADVYALGAILYECLTGRPPFKAATVMDTIMQVVSDEPVPPRRLQSTTPKDLETICLKCLHKDASKRYATAAALAEDLERFRRGEPIAARPVGRLEHGWRWCRRNPAMAGMMSAVATALLLGAIVSSHFAVDASHQAEQARQSEATAKANEEEAKRNEAAVLVAHNDLEKSNDQLLMSVAHSLLRPLAVQVRPGQAFPPLSDPEREALWELAGTSEEKLRLRFVEEAVHGPAETRQLKHRVAYALQAALTLDDSRRAKAELLLGERLRARGITLEQRSDLALVLTQIDIQDSTLAREVVHTLMEAKANGTANYIPFQDLSQALTAVTAHMEAKETAIALTQAMTKKEYLRLLPQLAQALSAVATRLEPKEAAAVCGQAGVILSQALTHHETDFYQSQSLLQSLPMVAVRMDSSKANEASAILLRHITRESDYRLASMAQGLSVVASRMEPTEAAKGCSQAAEILNHNMTEKWFYSNALLHLAPALSAVAAHMEPSEAAVVCGKAASILSQAMTKTDGLQSPPLAQKLSEVASRMEPKEAADVCGREVVRLRQSIVQMKYTHQAYVDQAPPRAQALSILAARMDPKEAAAECSKVAVILSQLVSKTTEFPFSLSPQLLQSLSAVAARMEPKEAAAVCGKAAAAVRLAITKNANFFKLPQLASPQLAQSLMAVAAFMEPEEAAAMCGKVAVTLSQAMTKKTNQNMLHILLQGLSVVTSRTGPKEAGEAALILTNAMSKETESYPLRQLAQGLLAVEAHMEAKVAGEAAKILGQAIAHTADSYRLLLLAQGLSAMAVRLEPKQAAAICGKVAATLRQGMTKSGNVILLRQLAQGLAAMAANMGPKEAWETAAILIQAMTNTTELDARQNLAPVLSLILLREDSFRNTQRYQGLTVTIGVLNCPRSVLMTPTLLQPTLKPLLTPLPAQTLVDLLKQPFCVGEARKLVLGQLSRHYQRAFADQWEFVRYATEQKLDLDLTSPPKRPGNTAVKP